MYKALLKLRSEAAQAVNGKLLQLPSASQIKIMGKVMNKSLFVFVSTLMDTAQNITFLHGIRVVFCLVRPFVYAQIFDIADRPLFLCCWNRGSRAGNRHVCAFFFSPPWNEMFVSDRWTVSCFR